MARPSFQFYPDDWLNDLGLRLCSPASRGIWMDLICLMHQGTPYGYLAGPTGALPIKSVATRCHVTVKQLANALQELEEHRVCERTPESVIFCRRMVRDERIRIARASGGPKSLDNPKVPRAKDTLKDILPGVHKGPTQEEEDVVLEVSTNTNQTLGKLSPGPIRQIRAADLNGHTSQKFPEWWDLWSKVRGTYNKNPACQAYISVVSTDLEGACFDCTSSYLASLESPNRGFNPENFLFSQAKDGFQARWPERKLSRSEALNRLLDEEG